jgi:hypothetical protein
MVKVEARTSLNVAISTMNELPAELHAQPLSVGLVMEEYDNIIVGKYYYAHRRAMDPSGNVFYKQDYILEIMDKGAASIGVTMKAIRFADSGTEWVSNTDDANDVLIYDRSECSAEVLDSLTFWRPLLDDITHVVDAETTSENTTSTEDQPTVTVQ